MLWRNEDFSMGKTKLRQKQLTKYKRKRKTTTKTEYTKSEGMWLML